MKIKFSAKPEEITALREALGWTHVDLGNFLGVYVLRERKGKTKYSPSNRCRTVYEWEQGKRRPQRSHILRMARLVETIYPMYLQVLQDEKQKFNKAVNSAFSQKIQQA